MAEWPVLLDTKAPHLHLKPHLEELLANVRSLLNCRNLHSTAHRAFSAACQFRSCSPHRLIRVNYITD